MFLCTHQSVTNFLQTWKLREEGRLLEIVDPELGEYPEKEITRFIKVALFCTQAAAHQRPGMKQVVKMLSEEVNLNEQLLTAPGIYRAHTSRWEKGKLSANFAMPSGLESVTQMLPR